MSTSSTSVAILTAAILLASCAGLPAATAETARVEGSPHRSSARSQPVQSRDTAARCEQARNLAAASRNRSAVGKAADRLGYCDHRLYGRAIARLASMSRHERDSAELAEDWRRTRWIIDASVLRAATDVAEDRTATVLARIYALRALLIARDPHADVSRFAEDALGAVGDDLGEIGCLVPRSDHIPPYRGEPLPHDYASAISSLATRLSGDRSEPFPVRVAAWCTLHNSTARSRIDRTP
jgi:hypothetical protein